MFPQWKTAKLHLPISGNKLTVLKLNYPFLTDVDSFGFGIPSSS